LLRGIKSLSSFALMVCHIGFEFNISSLFLFCNRPFFFHP